MEWLLTHIGENFEEYLIVSLLVTLFFKESLLAFINAKLGRENTPEWGKKATADINRLAEYANHDTTERLERLLEMGEKHQMNATETRDSLRDIGRTLSEIKTYGIPCRDK